MLRKFYLKSEFRNKPEKVIGMFSEALRIMDRNTTKYMIDDLTKQRDDAVSKLSATEAALDKSQQENAELKAQLAAYKASSSNTTV